MRVCPRHLQHRLKRSAPRLTELSLPASLLPNCCSETVDPVSVQAGGNGRGCIINAAVVGHDDFGRHLTLLNHALSFDNAGLEHRLFVHSRHDD